MKELVRHIFRRDYLSNHPVENPQVASLIRIVENPKRGHARGSEEYVESLRLQFEKASSFYYFHPQSSNPHRFQPKDLKLSFSQLADQLDAIDQLGRSGNRQALSYLRHLSVQNVRVDHRSRSVMAYSPDTIYHSWKVEKHAYPNSRGALRFSLDFDIQTTTTETWGDKFEISPEKIQEQLGMVRQLPSHMILNNAIDTLEQDLTSS